MSDRKAEIYILKYHGESGQMLKEQALNSLKSRLNKLLDAMDRLELKLQEGKIKKITAGMKGRMLGKINEIEEAAKTFVLDKEIIELTKIAEARIQAED